MPEPRYVTDVRDCICIGEINTSDGKLAAEISQNVLEIDSLKAK